MTVPVTAATPGAPAVGAVEQQPVDPTPAAPALTAADLAATLNAFGANLLAQVDAKLATAQPVAPAAPVVEVAAPVGSGLIPAAEVALDELFVLLNLAPTPNQVAVVTEWLVRYFPGVASPPTPVDPAAAAVGI
jgi:hypothetical protein